MTVAEPGTRENPVVGMRVGDAADDPVTGPLPAIQMHDGRVRVHVDRGVVVVSLDGGLDDVYVDEVAPSFDGALAGAEAAVLDVDQVMLLDEAAFRRLAAAFASACPHADRCMVASRLSGRMVLERWGIAAEHTVFTSVADALQARAFVASGYGNGWRPTA